MSGHVRNRVQTVFRVLQVRLYLLSKLVSFVIIGIRFLHVLRQSYQGASENR